MVGSSDGTARIATPQGFMALTSGTRLGNRYTIDSVIAAGGFGITYLGRHDALNKVVAIKEHFPRQFAYRDGASNEVRPTDPGVFSWALDRFLQEGRALASCKHPHVVDVTDIIESNGTAYMVLGYEEGHSLKNWLESLGRPPTQSEVDDFLGPLLDALAFVHAQDLLHRDIAPDNILIRRDGRPCLIDFGSARQALAQRSQLMSAIIKSGYSPPEQYTTTGKAQGPWSDIYALAATLYRVVTGRAPPEATERVSDDEVRKLADDPALRAAWRPGFLAAIDAALALKQAERPQSISAWRPMLLATAPAQNILERAQAFVRDMPPADGARARARSPQALTVGVALALLMAGGGYYGFVHLPGKRVVERQRVEDTARTNADAARQAAEAEARLLAESERKRLAAEAEERRRIAAEAEARRLAEEEQKRAAQAGEEQKRAAQAGEERQAEDERKAEEERKRLAAEAEAQRRAEDDRRLAEEQRRRAETDAARKKDEERRRQAVEADARRRAEQAAAAKAEEERRRREQERQTAQKAPVKPTGGGNCAAWMFTGQTCTDSRGRTCIQQGSQRLCQ